MTSESTQTPLARYSHTCQESAKHIIDSYSTSFGASVRLLGKRHRAHIRNIYALVRVADELVDGVATEAGVSLPRQRALLDRLEQDTLDAIEEGFSTNPVIHSFAATARECSIETDLIVPFFASMRTDLDPQEDALTSFSPEEHATYVYGSAEVIGLMCVRVFTRNVSYSPKQQATLTEGARALGAAFQNINFLRDLADDSGRLGRDYLNVDAELTEQQRNEWIAIIEEQLEHARATLPLLPKDARRAVRCALDLFAALSHRLALVPAAHLHYTRVRVPNPVKFVLLARASTHTLMERA